MRGGSSEVRRFKVFHRVSRDYKGLLEILEGFRGL